MTEATGERTFAGLRLRGSRFVPAPWAAMVVQGAGALSILWALSLGQVSWHWWALSIGVYFLTSCLGVAVTVHRALTHRAFELRRPVERLFCTFAALGMTGSPLAWIAIHRTHHAHADTDEDPHGPGHHGWRLLFTGPDPILEWKRVRDILRDPYQVFLHRYYLLVIAAWMLLLLAIHPLVLIFAFIIPAATQITVTNLSTILAHGHGYRNFETRDDSTNNTLISVLTWGDGWHNNHHARPRHWSIWCKWWEVDVPHIAVRALVSLGAIRRDSFYEPL